jgi:hypothetical protein
VANTGPTTVSAGTETLGFSVFGCRVTEGTPDRSGMTKCTPRSQPFEVDPLISAVIAEP